MHKTVADDATVLKLMAMKNKKSITLIEETA